jgi:hypothetical protein
LATGRAEPETLSSGLDKLDAAGFCGLSGFLRLGNRGTESGIFLPGKKAAELSTLPKEAISICSPDGREIAFYKYTADRAQEIAIEDDLGGKQRTLWVVGADGSHPERLLDYVGTTHDGLDWTRDGKAIIFAGLAGDRLQIFSERRSGGKALPLTSDSGNLMHPRVSPDGRWIACTRIIQSKQIWRHPL